MIVNSAPRSASNCSPSRGNLFTLPWNPCSRSRGNAVHHRVEYAPAFEDFDFTAKRSITKVEIKEIYTLGWLNDARPLLLIGETGVGKTFIAQAVGLHACASGKSVLYMSITALQENLAIARSSGTYLRYRAKLAKFDLIIFDERGMRKFTATEAQDLCEIIEEDRKSVV